ncbi:MAG TPA: HAD family phosphatase [bacterium]|nr:HAD family phosphatase [bacterium]HOM27512.1 HAD family phosphatase [bacterium]
MNLKGIVFDGDGVLFDTEKLHVIAWKTIFKFHNIELTEDDFAEGVGVEDRVFLKNLKKKGKIKKIFKIEELVSEKNKQLLKIVNKKNLGVSEETKKILKFLKNKYKIALASNSEKKFVLKVLKISDIYKFFDLVITRNDVKKPKPFPDIYTEVSRKLKIPAKNIIAFEDSETGIISAKSSGIFCVALPSTQPLEKIKIADIIIHKLSLNNVKKVIKIFEEKNES